MRAALFLLAAAATAQTPPAVLEVFRVAAESLAEQDAARFFSLFDPKMEGMAELRLYVSALVAAEGAASTVQVVTESGDEDRRETRVSWLLRVGPSTPRRGLLTCVLERRGGEWRIVALTPVAFFGTD